MSEQPIVELSPATLLTRRECLEAVSKNVDGEARLLDRDAQECLEPRCATFKTDHLLRVAVRSHEPCDSRLSRLLDGSLVVRTLAHSLAGGTGKGRGYHRGQFRWSGAGTVVDGGMTGTTNVGTHRAPAFDSCQECDAGGYMEGQLRGRVIKSREPGVVGCEVVAAYRLLFDPSAGFADTSVTGTIEGVLVCACGAGECVDFRPFPEAAHPNPWTVGGNTYLVLDHAGAPKASARVIALGGLRGLDIGFSTRVTLGTPASSVDVTLAHFASPATVTALDGSGAAVDSATMTVAGATETIHLSSADIATVEIKAANDETVLLRFCAG